jgi:hypothetical protein
MKTFGFAIVFFVVCANAQFILRIAGNGTASFSGDGGPAQSATVKQVFGIAVDDTGNIFVGDSQNHVVRKVDGITRSIITFAGRPNVQGLTIGSNFSDSLFFEPAAMV